VDEEKGEIDIIGRSAGPQMLAYPVSSFIIGIYKQSTCNEGYSKKI